MTRKVSNFSDLIQRVTASCLLHPLAAARYDAGDKEETPLSEEEEETRDQEEEEEESEEDEEFKDLNGGYEEEKMMGLRVLKVKQMDAITEEVFETVSSMKRAYVRLQEAHSPWEPEKMRAADVAVVSELWKLAVLRERFRRSSDGGGGGRGRRGRRRMGSVVASVREVVAPYEAVVEELKKEVKVKDLEVQNLKEKLESVVALSSNGSGEKKPGRSQSKRKLGIQAIAASPTPELFEATMMQVREASKSFTSLFLSLMHNAHWDITAAVRSIEAATASTDNYHTSTTSIVSAHHAKYALESYISRKIFQGFDHETFYMDGSLSSLLNPDQFR